MINLSVLKPLKNVQFHIANGKNTRQLMTRNITAMEKNRGISCSCIDLHDVIVFLDNVLALSDRICKSLSIQTLPLLLLLQLSLHVVIKSEKDQQILIVIIETLYTLFILCSWTVPEEFRLWRERMDAVESKKLAILAASNNSNSSSTSNNNGKKMHNSALGSTVNLNSKTSNGSVTSSDGSSSATSTAMNSHSTNHGRRKNNMDEFDSQRHVDITYSTVEEAVDAFKAMLADKKVSEKIMIMI